MSVAIDLVIRTLERRSEMRNQIHALKARIASREGQAQAAFAEAHLAVADCERMRRELAALEREFNR